MKLTPHPLSNLFPRMSEADRAALKNSLRANGQREPIVMLDGMILDGRHRAEAMLEIEGSNLLTRDYDPATDGPSPVQYVMDKNANRRQLTPSQRAQIAADAVPFYEAEAAARQKAGKANTNLPAAPQQGTAVAKAAKSAGASERLTASARRVAKADPKLAEKVKAGEVTVTQAEKQIAVPPPPPPVPASSKFEYAMRSKFQFDGLVKVLRDAKKQLQALAESEIGCEIPRAQVLASMESVIAAVRFAVPAHQCPYMPQCSTGTCKTCKGSEWVTAAVYERIPAEVKG